MGRKHTKNEIIDRILEIVGELNSTNDKYILLNDMVSDTIMTYELTGERYVLYSDYKNHIKLHSKMINVLHDGLVNIHGIIVRGMKDEKVSSK